MSYTPNKAFNVDIDIIMLDDMNTTLQVGDHPTFSSDNFDLSTSISFADNNTSIILPFNSNTTWRVEANFLNHASVYFSSNLTIRGQFKDLTNSQFIGQEGIIYYQYGNTEINWGTATAVIHPQDFNGLNEIRIRPVVTSIVGQHQNYPESSNANTHNSMGESNIQVWEIKS